MAEIERMFGIWDAARLVTKERLSELGEKDGGFLFGGFSVADAFFWPVLWVRCSLFLRVVCWFADLMIC